MAVVTSPATSVQQMSHITWGSTRAPAWGRKSGGAGWDAHTGVDIGSWEVWSEHSGDAMYLVTLFWAKLYPGKHKSGLAGWGSSHHPSLC